MSQSYKFSGNTGSLFAVFVQKADLCYFRACLQATHEVLAGYMALVTLALVGLPQVLCIFFFFVISEFPFVFMPVY